MTKDEVIALAREAGLWEIFEHYSGEFADGNPEVCLEELERFAALVAQAEREQKPVAWMYREPGNPFLRVHVDEFDYEQIPEDDEWFPVYRQAKRSTHDQNDHS